MRTSTSKTIIHTEIQCFRSDLFQLSLNCLAAAHTFFHRDKIIGNQFSGGSRQVCLNFDAVVLVMKEAARLRELEAECRQHALDEPERKWYWLAQAAKYQVQADQQTAFQSEQFEAADSPEVVLAQWPNGRDERRRLSCATREELDGFYHPEDRRQDSGVTFSRPLS